MHIVALRNQSSEKLSITVLCGEGTGLNLFNALGIIIACRDRLLIAPLLKPTCRR